MNVAVYCINIFVYVCFVEEVLLADDENENDYDGNNLLFCLFCVCVCLNLKTLKDSNEFNTFKHIGTVVL